MIVHSAGTGANTDENKEAEPSIRQALRTKVANLQVQAGMVELSSRFHGKLLGDLNNKVDIPAA